MKAEKFIDPIGDIGDEYLEESEVRATAKVYPWVKWVAAAACVLVAVLISVPAILSSKAGAENTPDTSLRAAATITDEAREGIKSVLTTPNYELASEDELAGVTLGLPIAEYGLYLDDNGGYYLSSSEFAQVYPVYVNGALAYLVGCGPTGIWGYYEPYLATSDYENEPLHEECYPWHQELYERLAAGNAGSLALVYAADGTYLYDGTTFVRVHEQGNGVDQSYFEQFDGNGTYIDWPEPSVEPPQKMSPAALEGANLPAELLAQIRLTDTSVTEPLI